MYHIIFIHSSMGWTLGCFQLLAIVNYAAMNMNMQIVYWFFMCTTHILQKWVNINYLFSNLHFIFLIFYFCFPSYEIAQKATVNITLCCFGGGYLEWITRCDTTRSKGILLNIIRFLSLGLHILHSHQQHMRVPVYFRAFPTEHVFRFGFVPIW